MGRGLLGVGAVALAAVLLAAGCAGRRIERGVYHSPKGYRLTIPGPDWRVVEASRADLELRHAGGDAGILAHATCGAAARRSAPALERELLAGLRARRVVERAEVSVNGYPGAHAVVEAARDADGEPVRIAVYTLRGRQCVWDLIYAAPAARFDRWRADFERFVGSFEAE